MKVFTLDCCVFAGANVTTFIIQNGAMSIPAIIIGESGRGRSQGVLPVELLPENYKKWKAGERVRIEFAEVITTKSGKPKLKELADHATTVTACICVMPTKYGFRGGNEHTGEQNGTKGEFTNAVPTFAPFPAMQILAEGATAQGDAGRMGGGTEYIAVMPERTVFRTAYSGRLYGAPSEHLYWYNAGEMVCGTPEELSLIHI